MREGAARARQASCRSTCRAYRAKCSARRQRGEAMPSGYSDGRAPDGVGASRPLRAYGSPGGGLRRSSWAGDSTPTKEESNEKLLPTVNGPFDNQFARARKISRWVCACVLFLCACVSFLCACNCAGGCQFGWVAASAAELRGGLPGTVWRGGERRAAVSESEDRPTGLAVRRLAGLARGRLQRFREPLEPPRATPDDWTAPRHPVSQRGTSHWKGGAR
eukprot:GHVT01037316.1.p1 GENE.GHVT01037316.1~~GHVT01037316.1.p1  ORF type:complete len:219 (+),score=24.70 GHVT01037316.1:501-1157(+)